MSKADRHTTVNDLARYVKSAVRLIGLALVALVVIYISNEADDDRNRREAVIGVCGTIEDFALAEENALVAIFKDSVSEERIEAGRAQFSKEIAPALERCLNP